MNFAPSQTPVAGNAGTRDRSHRVRSEEPRGVYEETGSAGNQARVSLPAGSCPGYLDRVHQRSVGHLYRADRGVGEGELISPDQRRVIGGMSTRLCRGKERACPAEVDSATMISTAPRPLSVRPCVWRSASPRSAAEFRLPRGTCGPGARASHRSRQIRIAMLDS